MKPHWTYQDIIDLEYFLNQNRSVKESILHERDRSIFLSQKEADTNQEDTHGALLHRWLTAMKIKSVENGDTCPGALFDEALRLLKLILPSTTIVAGFLMGLGFFSYSGENPINVFHFLILFVFSQLSLLLLLFITPLLSAVGLVEESFPLSHRMFTSLVARNVNRAQQRLSPSVSGAKRDGYNQLLGLVRKIRHKYGRLLYYPFFLLSQRMMIGLNIGFLAATLLKITASDVAFGWQSTIQISSVSLFNGVKTLALPWSWLLSEGTGYPSLSAIEGSRIILKDGIYHLATADLVSWWPFLLLCLLVYGLLLRIILTLIASWAQHYALFKISFDTIDAQSVIRRMQNPLVSMKGSPAVSIPSSEMVTPGLSTPGKKMAAHSLILLIPHEVSVSCKIETLLMFLKRYGFVVENQITIPEDYDGAQKTLSEIETHLISNDCGFFLLLESWMPPIGEVLTFIKALRAALSDSTPLYIGLIGKPSQTGSPTPPTPLENQVWQQHLDRLADPYLTILPYQDDDDT